MPRAARIKKEDAIEALVKYKDYFSADALPKHGSGVWKKLAKECDGLWTRANWYTNVTCDRRNILCSARELMGLQPLILKKRKTALPNSDDSFHLSESELEDKESWFTLILNMDDWSRIKPTATESGDMRRQLKPFVWTNVIAAEFHRQHQLPCAFSFRRADITTSNKTHYLKIKGKCRSNACNNLFSGYIDKEPQSTDTHVMIRIKTRNTQREAHEDVRRYLNGDKRREFGEQCQGEGCSVMLKRLRRENMQRGDIEGPNLPKADILRHAKHEYVNRELGIKKSDDDLVQRIYNMQFEKAYMACINAIGYNPFYCFYQHREQLTLFKNYCELTKEWSSISIDGTGSLMRKIKRPLDTMSRHIFLQSIVIHFGKEIVSVSQMLSESQEMETLLFWLKRWIDLVKVKPRHCVSDCSRALLTSCCLGFNKMTIKPYLNILLAYTLTHDRSLLDQISTYIRIDVAHLIHFVCRWECTKSIKRRAVRDFFIRSVALMVDCQYLHEFQEVFILTCAVGSNVHEDTTLNLESVRTVKEARAKLEGYMNKRNVDIQGFLETVDLNVQTENLEKLGDDMNGYCSSDIYIQILQRKAQSIVAEGTELNSFYVPNFINQLIRIGREFLLWTAVGIPYFIGHASSSCSEKNHADLKNLVMKKYSRRIGAEKFLRIHLNDLIGGTRSMASKITRFLIDNNNLPKLREKAIIKVLNPDEFPFSANPLGCEDFNSADDFIINEDDILIDDPDLLSSENWKGKVTPGIFDQYAKMDTGEPETDTPTNREEEINNTSTLNIDINSSEDEDKENTQISYYMCDFCFKRISTKSINPHECRQTKSLDSTLDDCIHVTLSEDQVLNYTQLDLLDNEIFNAET